jgi:hypothetical protein
MTDTGFNFLHLLLITFAVVARECGELARWGWRKLSRP